VPAVDGTTALGKAIAGHPELIPGKPFPNNFIPADLFVDPAAMQVMQVGSIPKANSSGDLISR
jgi:hypothetical protein